MSTIGQDSAARSSQAGRDFIPTEPEMIWPVENAARIASEINATGFACLSGAVPAEFLAEARARAERAVEENLGEYISFKGQDGHSGYLLKDLHADPGFIQLCKRVCEEGLNVQSSDADFYQILRCLKGQSAARHSNYLHYDSYCLTVLFPIAMPAPGSGGELLLFPSSRPIRKSYWASAIEKAIIDRAPTQWLLNKAITARLLKPVRLILEPGSVYFFWGYRTLHTNNICSATSLRATELLHYANPHEASTTSTLSKKLRIFERRIPSK